MITLIFHVFVTKGLLYIIANPRILRLCTTALLSQWHFEIFQIFCVTMTKRLLYIISNLRILRLCTTALLSQWHKIFEIFQNVTVTKRLLYINAYVCGLRGREPKTPNFEPFLFLFPFQEVRSNSKERDKLFQQIEKFDWISKMSQFQPKKLLYLFLGIILTTPSYSNS